MRQNPFSLYDFLGYLIPGALLLYTLTYLFEFSVIATTLGINGENDSTSNQLVSYVPSIILAYLIGHILALGSSALIEAFAQYLNGYPSEFLFGIEREHYLSSKKKWGVFGRMVLWIVVLPVSAMTLLCKQLLDIRMFDQAKSLPKPLRTAVYKKCEFVLSDNYGGRSSGNYLGRLI